MIEDARELEHAAQRAAEARLAHCVDELNADWEETYDEGFTAEECTCSAPFCGCDTCMVREVIHAAWPYLYRLAMHPDTAVPRLPE